MYNFSLFLYAACFVFVCLFVFACLFVFVIFDLVAANHHENMSV